MWPSEPTIQWALEIKQPHFETKTENNLAATEGNLYYNK